MVGWGSTVSVAVAPLRNAAIAGSEGGRLLAPSGATTVMSFGGVTTGGVVSCTSTVVVAVPTLPELSLALHVTVVEPSGKVEPEAGTHVAVTLPFTRSDALAAP